MWKAGWFLQKRSVKKCEEVWWNIVVITPDQWLCTRLVVCIKVDLVVWIITFLFYLFDSYTDSSFSAMQIF